jgi:predicted Zn-dependent protease with MMP-like domain
VTIGQFEGEVAQALEAIPEVLRAHLATVQITTAPYPTPRQRRGLGLRRAEALYGLYEGLSVPERLTQGDTGEPPSRIKLAHHFGIDDERLEAWGVY